MRTHCARVYRNILSFFFFSYFRDSYFNCFFVEPGQGGFAPRDFRKDVRGCARYGRTVHDTENTRFFQNIKYRAVKAGIRR